VVRSVRATYAARTDATSAILPTGDRYAARTVPTQRESIDRWRPERPVLCDSIDR